MSCIGQLIKKLKRTPKWTDKQRFLCSHKYTYISQNGFGKILGSKFSVEVKGGNLKANTMVLNNHKHKRNCSVKVTWIPFRLHSFSGSV